MEKKTGKKLPGWAIIIIIVGVSLYCVPVIPGILFGIMIISEINDPYPGGFDTVARFGDGRYHIDKGTVDLYNGEIIYDYHTLSFSEQESVQHDCRVYSFSDVAYSDDCHSLYVEDVISYYESDEGYLYVCGREFDGDIFYVIDLNKNRYEYHESTEDFSTDIKEVFSEKELFTVFKDRHKSIGV